MGYTRGNGEADHILRNARIWTGRALSGKASAVAVKKGRIAAVGSDAEVLALAGTATQVRDCGGRPLLPGFVDAHVHLLGFAETFSGVDCRPSRAPSIGALQALIRERAAETPAGGWVRAYGYHQFFLEGGSHPTRRDLDAAAPHHPVRLIHQNRHICVLNSLALQAAGIGRHTPDPPGGIIEKDAETGELTGLLIGMNLWLGKNVVPPLGLDELRKGVRLASQSFLSQGVTCVHDASPRNGLAEWQLYKELAEKEDLSVRVRMMVGVDGLDRVLGAGLRPQDCAGPYLKLGPVKIVIEQVGPKLYPAPAVLAAQVRKAHEAGFQVAIHAITPRAIKTAVETVKSLGVGEGQRRRHRLEHCTYLPYGLIEDLREAGVTVVGQPSFIYFNGARYLGEVPADKFSWVCREQSLLRVGVPLAGSTDTPVVPNSIMAAIGAAVTRDAQVGFAFGRKETMSIGDAVGMFTIGAARAGFDELDLGEVEPNRLADLVVWEKNPADVAPGEIKQLRPRVVFLSRGRSKLAVKVVEDCGGDTMTV
ncbi:MAG: amidohydrolase [Chloroflexi bacterium]|nr:amidohydrolase [Chloroflexota bacterium]